MDIEALLKEAPQHEVTAFRNLCIAREQRKTELEQAKRDIKEYDVLIGKKYKVLKGDAE